MAETLYLRRPRPPPRGRAAARLTIGAVLAAAGFGAAPAGAAEALDLLAVWRLAQTQDAGIRAAEAAAAAGRERVPQALAALRPRIVLDATGFLTEQTNSGSPADGESGNGDRYHSGQQTLSLRQPLYRPQQWAQLAQARAQEGQTEARLARDRQALATRVAESYFDALLAADVIRLVQVQQDNAATQLEAARKSLAAGTGLRTDIEEAQARVDLLLAQALEARQQQAAALQTLGTLATDAIADVVPLDARRFQPIAAEPLGVWLARAEANSPELQSLAAQRDAAVEAVESRRAEHRPTLDLVAQWQRSDRQQFNRADDRYTSKQIGLQFNLPLYAGGGTDSAVRQAVAELTQATEGLEAARRDFATRVAREWRGVTEGEARVRALGQAVRSSELALQANRKSFQAGARTTLDVLQAQELNANVQRDLARVRYLHLVSLVRLHALAGLADAALIENVNGFLEHALPADGRRGVTDRAPMPLPSRR